MIYQHYACFRCRKVFRRPSRWARAYPPPEGVPLEVSCPLCRIPTAAMGICFKAPRQADRAQWKKAELLYQNGYAFHRNINDGPEPRPATLSEIPAFLRQQEAKKRGAERQNAIAVRAEQREKKRKAAAKARQEKLIARQRR